MKDLEIPFIRIRKCISLQLFPPSANILFYFPTLCLYLLCVIITCQTNPIKSLSQQDKSCPAPAAQSPILFRPGAGGKLARKLDREGLCQCFSRGWRPLPVAHSLCNVRVMASMAALHWLMVTRNVTMSRRVTHIVPTLAPMSHKYLAQICPKLSCFTPRGPANVSVTRKVHLG